MKIGPYLLKRNEGLYLQDQLLAVPPKELALLCLLAERAGSVVSHAEIEHRLWPRQIVSYASLTRCVYSLRKLLERGGEKYIQTVPKRGYRLVAPVAEHSSTADTTVAAAREPLVDAHYRAAIAEFQSTGLVNSNRALRLLNQSQSIDSRFVPAYSASAEVLIYQCLRGFISPAKALAEAVSACESALALDPDHVPALAALGWLQGLLGGDLPAGMARLDHALALDPNCTRGLIYRAWLKRAGGRADAALADVARAVELDPHSNIIRHAYAWSLFCGGKPEAALQHESSMVDEYPEDDVAIGYYGVFSAYLGHSGQALEAARKLLELFPEIPMDWAAAAYIEAHSGSRKRAQSLLEQMPMLGSHRCSGAWVAPVLLAMGDRVGAHAQLTRALANRCPWAKIACIDPRLETLDWS